MTTKPTVIGPDGTASEKLVFSTTIERQFFHGTIPEAVVEMQISVNGSGYAADSALVVFGGSDWTVPNPSYEPDGLLLRGGANIILLRGVLANGSVTSEVSIEVTLVSSATVGIVAQPPTNISVEQQNYVVKIRVEEPFITTGFQGLNFYASQESGGGNTGYLQINIETISDGEPVEEETVFQDFLVESDVAVDADGVPLADPLFLRTVSVQEDGSDTVLATDFNERHEVPETTRKVRFSGAYASVRDITMYSFSHSRSGSSNSEPPTIAIASFGAMPTDTPLFYVATAIYYDSALNLQYESSFSEEVAGHPLKVTGAMVSLPTPSRKDIVTSFITSIFRSNPQIRVDVGSVLRDTVIDPFASETERLRFLLDFYHRARTPLLMLQVDDPSGSGSSLPVPSSAYKKALKQALFMLSDADVQGLVDSTFDAYASNFALRRMTGTTARSEVTFFVRGTPTASILFPVGTIVSAGSMEFNTTKSVAIDLSSLAGSYNPSKDRYEVNVGVKASQAGTTGNVGAGQITRIVSTIQAGQSVQVTNSGAAVGGDNRESNLALTTRVMNRLASVDSGTARGYLQVAADTPGVVKANVVAAGNPLMQRDIGSDGKHHGGKVDVWVQGTNDASVTDTFAFSFDIKDDMQFEVMGDPTDYTFRATDPELTSLTPIAAMLDYPDVGYELRNISTGEVFDLTDVEVTSYNTIQLSTDVVQPSVSLDDVVLGAYRMATANKFVFVRQPMGEVLSVVGTSSGELPTDAFEIVRPDPPLEVGRSSLAQAYLNVIGYTDDNGVFIPSGDLTAVTGEVHVLTGEYVEYASNLGALYYTLEVTSVDGLTTYRGPDDPSGTPDYYIDQGTQIEAVGIRRAPDGDIASGTEVLFSYSHDENFTVTYTTNLIVAVTQEELDVEKHATADVVVKEAVPVPVDLSASVILLKGRDRTTVDTALRTNLTNQFSNLRLGDALRQSDVIRTIENTEGVSYVVVPLTTMIRQEGSSVVREEISSDVASDSNLIESLSTASSLVYILVQELSAATTNGGGGAGEFKGVFQDEIPMVLLESVASLTALGLGTGRTYIIGAEGRVIDGYSDDATLEAQGYVTAASQTERRLELTANRVLVSLVVGTSPTDFSYAATYVVGADSGAKNIDPSAAAIIEEGDISITYDEEQ